MAKLEIQRRLRALGYDPGPLDGVRGRRTIAALKAFQAAHGLEVDGLAGPATLEKLMTPPHPAAPQPPSPARGEGWLRPWFEEALRLKGLRETAGVADNPVILEWASRLGLGYAHDSVAWCGLFVAHCIAFALPEEPLPNNPLAARGWLRFGTETEPTLGAVLVFWRGAKTGWQGHVGFYAGEDSSAFHVLGGNQADSVSIARLAKTRLLGARWPSGAPQHPQLTITQSATGELSTDEA